MIDNVLAKNTDGLEPRLTSEGYNNKVLAELLNAKPQVARYICLGCGISILSGDKNSTARFTQPPCQRSALRLGRNWRIRSPKANGQGPRRSF